MTFLKHVFLAVFGVAAGVGVSGGVFTSLIAVGLIPRFAGKTHTGERVFLYEEMVVLGTILGNIISVFDPFIKPFLHLQGSGVAVLIIYGFFAGTFVGCLALAIAEMLNSIPIFARRIGFRHGLGIAILFMAIAKALGSLLYFAKGFYIQ